MFKRKKLAFLLIAVGILIGVFYVVNLSGSQQSPIKQPALIKANKPLSSSLVTLVKQPNYKTKLIDLQARWKQTSLAGSSVDRASVSLKNNQLVLSGGVLIYFDYFLSLQGEMDMPLIKQFIYNDMQQHYSEAIVNLLYPLFERYVEYLLAVDKTLDALTYEEVKSEGITEQSIANELRAEFFTHSEVDSLFNDYDKMLSFTSQSSTFQQKMRSYKSANANDAYAVATELFGAEAAARLQQRKSEKQQWQQRLAVYFSEKSHIVEAKGLANDDKKAAINALLIRSFNSYEQVRIKTLDHIKNNE